MELNILVLPGDGIGVEIMAEAVKVLLGMARGPLAPVDARSVVLKVPRRRRVKK